VHNEPNKKKKERKTTTYMIYAAVHSFSQLVVSIKYETRQNCKLFTPCIYAPPVSCFQSEFPHWYSGNKFELEKTEIRRNCKYDIKTFQDCRHQDTQQYKWEHAKKTCTSEIYAKCNMQNALTARLTLFPDAVKVQPVLQVIRKFITKTLRNARCCSKNKRKTAIMCCTTSNGCTQSGTDI